MDEKLTLTWLVYWSRTARSVFTGAGLKWPNTAGQYSTTILRLLVTFTVYKRQSRVFRYPFAAIDTPLVKIENWIAYTKNNSTVSKMEKSVINSLRIVFRVENFFMFLSCFAVPFFFSLMCDVIGKEWKRFVAYLKLDTTRADFSVPQLRNIRNSHWMLCKIFYFLDDCFSKMILFIYVLFVVVNSSIIFIVLKFGTVASGKDRFAFYQACLMFVALEVIFFAVIRQAMRVHAIVSSHLHYFPSFGVNFWRHASFTFSQNNWYKYNMYVQYV